MEAAEAMRELKRIQNIIPELIACLADAGQRAEPKPKRFETAKYFRTLYDISPSTYQDRRDGIREQILIGRYPENAMQDRLIDKAVFYDYNKHRYKIKHCPRQAPEYDPKESMRAALILEGIREAV
ncbi:hypothetical protein [Claveliimonas bilis]|uniref:hypothetical protein n=1 Tax=Claveliimonas bilis TaxID=3028070 RepID=UPI00292DCAC9|nr:hypothetical protein [Claveliimonas bilis]BDZ81379.1 hypothetical protein Lac3_25880 [Claveliimonas bilis]